MNVPSQPSFQATDGNAMQGPTPRVSVIISTYNRAGLLPEAIDSALAQTFTDLEVIVVDDGSEDNTQEVVSAYRDRRVRYLRQENAGSAAGRNRGIQLALGDYVAFLDDDDLLLPHKLEVQVGFMDAQPDIGWTSGGYRLTDMEGRLIEERRPWLEHTGFDTATWLFECLTAVHAVLVRREWLLRSGGFDEASGNKDDWSAWLRLAHAGCPMAWVEEIVCVYRQHPANSVRSAASTRKNRFAMLDHFYAQDDLASELVDLRPQVYCRAYLTEACRTYGAGLAEQGSDDLARAIELCPRLLDQEGRAITDMIAAYAAGRFVTDPVAYVNGVFDNLPACALGLRERRRATTSQAAMALFYRAHSRGDYRTVARMFAVAARHDPRRLADRGTWSILARSLKRAAHA